MNDRKTEICIKYLMSKLAPADQNELSGMLGDDMSDLASDALKGRLGLSLDKLPDRLRRQALSRVMPDRSAAVGDFNERYPDAARIKRVG